MNELSLFTGAGGGVLGTHGLLGWRCKGYVEWEEYAQKVIRARIVDGILDEAPIFTDVREFVDSGAARQYRGFIDVVSGGFPCQPFSVAGKRAVDEHGNADDRDMWPATLGVIREVRPRFAFLENVRGLLSFNGGEYFRRILRQLSEIGYDARWCVLSARDCGAPHRRERIWIVAVRHTDSDLQSQKREIRKREVTESGRSGGNGGSEELPHASGAGAGENKRGLWDRSKGTNRGKNRPRQEMEHTTSAGLEGAKREKSKGGGERPTESGEELAHARREHGQPWNTTRMEADTGIGASCDIHNQSIGERWWDTDPADGATEPFVGRVAHGVAHRVDRLKAIGNGQVPIVAATAWQILTDDLQI